MQTNVTELQAAIYVNDFLTVLLTDPDAFQEFLFAYEGVIGDKEVRTFKRELIDYRDAVEGFIAELKGRQAMNQIKAEFVTSRDYTPEQLTQIIDDLRAVLAYAEKVAGVMATTLRKQTAQQAGQLQLPERKQ